MDYLLSVKSNQRENKSLPFPCFHSNHQEPIDILIDSIQTNVLHAHPNLNVLSYKHAISSYENPNNNMFKGSFTFANQDVVSFLLKGRKESYITIVLA